MSWLIEGADFKGQQETSVESRQTIDMAGFKLSREEQRKIEKVTEKTEKKEKEKEILERQIRMDK